MAQELVRGCSGLWVGIPALPILFWAIDVGNWFGLFQRPPEEKWTFPETFAHGPCILCGLEATKTLIHHWDDPEKRASNRVILLFCHSLGMADLGIALLGCGLALMLLLQPQKLWLGENWIYWVPFFCKFINFADRLYSPFSLKISRQCISDIMPVCWGPVKGTGLSWSHSQSLLNSVDPAHPPFMLLLLVAYNSIRMIL